MLKGLKGDEYLITMMIVKASSLLHMVWKLYRGLKGVNNLIAYSLPLELSMTVGLLTNKNILH